MINPKLNPNVWGDLLGQPLKIKLAFLWVHSHSEIAGSVWGIFTYNPLRMAAETGLPKQTLDELLEAFPDLFVREGKQILLVNWLAAQYGNMLPSVISSASQVGFRKSLRSRFREYPEAFKAAILSRYPQLRDVLTQDHPVAHGVAHPQIHPVAPTVGHRVGTTTTTTTTTTVPTAVQGGVGGERAPDVRVSGLDHRMGKELLDHLCAATGVRYQTKAAQDAATVALRLAGNDLEEAKCAVDRQVALYRDDPKRRTWLRPTNVFDPDRWPDIFAERNVSVAPPPQQSAETRRLRESLERDTLSPEERLDIESRLAALQH